MADQDWVSATQTATGPNGQKMALIEGEWKPAEQTATGPNGEKMALLGRQTQQPVPAATPPTPTGTMDRFKASLQSENPLEKAKQLEQPSEKPTVKGALGAIGTSTAFGAAVGALSPEIVTGLGIAAMAIPVVGEVAGPALLATGQALRGARLASTVMGAASGLTSETAGQAVESVGGTKGQAAAARLVAGGVPTVATAAGGALLHLVPGPLKTAYAAAAKFAGNTIETSKAVQTAKEYMAKMQDAAMPQTAMHAMLQKGIEADRQASEKAANAVMQRAHDEAARIAKSDTEAANRLVEDARTHADGIRADAARRAHVLDQAANGKLKTANKVLAQAQPELNKVGQVTELSDIGNTLRSAATETQGTKIAARNESYRALQTERDAIVAQKEASGQTLDKLPEMKALRAEIGKYTLSNEEGRKAAGGMAKATEPGVVRAYEQVENAVRNRRVKVGTDPETGADKFQTFKTSFEALDHVRRRLGDALAGGQDAEGYSALGKGIAGKLYERISKIQEAFVGKDASGRNLQRELQAGYAEGTSGLQGFGATSGRKLTATDRMDPERFNADPKTLPKYFFNSQQSVRDAKELTGNPVLVEQQASNYAARSMQGMSSKQAKSWIADNSDWMREVPGLQKNANAFTSKLAQIERINDKLAARAKASAKEAENIRDVGGKAAEKERQAGIERAAKAAEGSVATRERVLTEGSKAASAAKEAVAGPGERLGTALRSGEAPETVRKLLLNGNQEQTRLAASYMAGQPGGKQVLEASVRQVMRDMNENTLRKEWTERIRPMLVDGKMIPNERIATLEKDVNRILTAYKGPAKKSLLERHIVAALVSAGTAASTYAPGRPERGN